MSTSPPGEEIKSCPLCGGDKSLHDPMSRYGCCGCYGTGEVRIAPYIAPTLHHIGASDLAASVRARDDDVFIATLLALLRDASPPFGRTAEVKRAWVEARDNELNRE